MFNLIALFLLYTTIDANANDLSGTWISSDGSRVELFRIGNKYQLSTSWSSTTAKYAWSINDGATELYGKETQTIVDAKCRQQVLKFINNSTLQINSPRDITFSYYKIYYKRRIYTNQNGGVSYGDCQFVEAVENYTRLRKKIGGNSGGGNTGGGNTGGGGQGSNFNQCLRYAQRITDSYRADDFRFSCFRKYRYEITSSQCLGMAYEMRLSYNRDRAIKLCIIDNEDSSFSECRKYARRLSNRSEADDFRFSCFRKYRYEITSSECLSMANEMNWSYNKDDMIIKCYELDEIN